MVGFGSLWRLGGRSFQASVHSGIKLRSQNFGVRILRSGGQKTLCAARRLLTHRRLRRTVVARWGQRCEGYRSGVVDDAVHHAERCHTATVLEAL